jgi:hypothetical protein
VNHEKAAPSGFLNDYHPLFDLVGHSFLRIGQSPISAKSG